MFRVIIAVALIQHNLGKPLEDGLLIPHDVEMIPVEEHGHHIITVTSLERISIEDNEIPLNDDYEGEIDDNDNIPRPDRAIDTSPCSAEVEETDKRPDCKEESSEIEVKQVKAERLETTEHENVKTNEDLESNESVETSKSIENDTLAITEGQETNESVETTEGKKTEDYVESNESTEINERDTKESVETAGGKGTGDGVEKNEGNETNESVDTNENVEANEVVLLNQTIRMNNSAIVDGKLTIVLNFQVQDDHTVEVLSSEIVDHADVSKDIKESDDDYDDIVHFSGPIHAYGKVCAAAHYGCRDDHTVEMEGSEIVHPEDVSKDTNETVEDDDIVYFSGPVHAQGMVCVAAHYGCGDDHLVDSNEIVHPGNVSNDSNETVNDKDEDDGDEDDGDEDDGDEDDGDEDEDDDNVHFCGPIHAQGNVCVGAHYDCGGPPISMCFSRPCSHGQHFFHPTSENDHDFQDDKDLAFAHCQYRCPNIVCQYYPTVGSCGPFKIPEYRFDQDHHFDHHHGHYNRHHKHHYGHHQDHHFDNSQNNLFDHHQDHDFDNYQDKFDHSHEHHYEDFEDTRFLGNSDYDSGEEDDFPRWFPVSGYVPASGSVKIAARY